MMGFSSGMTYGFYGLMAVISALFVWKMVPETKGKSLEEINCGRNIKEYPVTGNKFYHRISFFYKK